MNNFEEYTPFLDLIADTKTDDGHSTIQNEFEIYGPFQGDEDEMYYAEDSSEYAESEDVKSVEEQEYEWEEESYTGENIINNEFEVSPDKGITDYINVSAVKNRNLKTGVFIPSGYQPSDKVDIVVYLHGLFANGDKTNGIEYYWKNYSNIRDYFYSTRRNAILIAPTLSSNPQNGDVIFNNPGGLDKFLTECLKALQVKGYLSVASEFINIIIAAHSAGGRPMARILGYPGFYKEKIIECWGFDCLYAEWWGQNINQWAQGKKKFYHYWAWSCSAKNLSSCPRVIGDKFTANPNFQNIAPIGKVGHRDIIENAWLYQILNRSWFEKAGSVIMSPDKELNIDSIGTNLYSQEDLENFNIEENLVPDISKAVRLNTYYAQTLGWNQYYDKINDFLLPFSGQQNVSLGEEDFAEAVAGWQSSLGFSAKDCDGIIGPNTWNKLKNTVLSTAIIPPSPTPVLTSQGTGSFTFSQYSLSSKPIVIKERDERRKYAEVREAPIVYLTEIVRNAGEDPQKWFNRFTKITFLGRSLKGDQYVQENLALHLKQLERKLAVQYGGTTVDPAVAGDTLMLTYEGFSGSRLVSSTATYSYHMFGLAVDMNYNGCPYIQAHDAFNTWMDKVAKLVVNSKIQGIDWGLGTNSTLVQYLKLYDDYAILNNYMKTYFSLLDVQNESMLSFLLSQCNFDPWNKNSTSHAKSLIQKDLSDIAKAWKGDRSNPEAIFKNGFLGVSREFVKVMVESGLDWGGRYGDIMHFDMRTAPGVGARIESAKRKYMRDIEIRSSELYRQTEHESLFNSDYESGYGEDFVSDIPKAIRLNRFYQVQLGWDKFMYEINDLILPFSGQQNVSLGEENFAQAVAGWQSSQGFSSKDCDGIIGPDTWKVMSRIITSSPTVGNSSTIHTSGLTYNLEAVPPYFSSDAVPAGFKKSSYKGWNGLDRKSIIRVDEAAKKINATISLSSYGITETDIDTFQRLADAETGGHIQNFYSLDMAIVSIGFRQFTFIHGNIHSWINKNPAAFKRYGIEIDDSSQPYRIKRFVRGKNKEYVVQRIKGVTDPETLRWNGWAQRFFYAGLDYEIIIAEFLLAKENFASELKRLKGHISSVQFAKFMNFYNQSGHVRAFFHELNNALPAYVPARTEDALIKTDSAQNADQFLQIYFQAVKTSWPSPDQAQRIFDNTKKGARVKVFENELLNIEASEDSSLYDNEMDFYETQQQNYAPEYEHSLDEFDSYVKDWSNAIRQNQYYANKLGWNQFYDKINDLLLPLSGQQNVSLGEEAFAQAVASWQLQQGFPANEADGIIGPHTWNRMKPLLNNATQPQPAPVTPASSTAPSIQNIFDFNRWHAQKILDSINAGIVEVNTHVKYNAKTLLEKIIRGEQVIMLNPKTTLIQVLPLMYHICELAGQNNYHDIIFGSFIRDAAADGSCTGHCAGRCIDINYRGGSFSNYGSVQMVTNILSYLLLLPAQFKKNLGFGLPFQGNFFDRKNLTKFRSTNPDYLIDPQLKQFIPQLGIVFPDNDNHMHIQVKWL